VRRRVLDKAGGNILSPARNLKHQVWDDRGVGHLRFDGDGDPLDAGGALGFISEHGAIHSSLFDRVRELEADGLAELTCPAQARKAQTDDGFGPDRGVENSRKPESFFCALTLRVLVCFGCLSLSCSRAS